MTRRVSDRGAVTGREAIIRASEAFFAAFPDATVTEETPLIDGDRTTIVAEVFGTHVGEILGLAPTGRAFRIPMAFLMVLRDHQIVFTSADLRLQGSARPDRRAEGQAGKLIC